MSWAEQKERILAARRGHQYVPAPVRPRFSTSPRPGLNLPLNGTAMYYGKPREAVDFDYALELVSEATDIPPMLIQTSTYSAAVAARHLLWCILIDGRHSYASVAQQFNMDQSSVRLAVAQFRRFQAEKARVQ